ncbi:MAG: DUF11 domain-containing protein [Flavobacteriales bacterium]|nr:DUF11 domain-containing protein [Flavobacteriales bacterium]MBW7853862.1 DUF11 domain-containing protein [Candidatus Kapabacteria bacterium]
MMKAKVLTSLPFTRLTQSIVPLLSAFVFLLSMQANGQTWVAEAQSNGFTLKKVVSDTSINIGQPFSYTVYYSIPAGASNVVISDMLPPSVEFLSASYTSPCGTPVVSAPTVGSQGGTYSLTWGSVPSGCSGSFTITVQFPNGITCNGTGARNRVCLMGYLNNKSIEFCTPYVSTTAKAVNPWNVNKWVLGAAYQGGQCQYATADSIITYQVCVIKDVGNTGQLNLVNGVVTDVLPTGAVLQSSTCGAVQTGNTITWTLPASMSATTMYNSTCCQFTVLYPRSLFPSGSQIKNTATLAGTLGSPNQSCGTVADTSQQTCVEIKTIQSATLSKWVYTNGQPGCPGKYQIWVCNTGTTTMNSYTITDTIPGALSGPTVTATSAGQTASVAGNIVTITSSIALAPGQCRYVEISFTIPVTAVVGSTITNCAWLSSPGMAPVKACVSFTVSATAPKLCLWKEVCSKKTSYKPGDTLRYRLRIQNVGGLALTGATITDNLNSNLSYIGNPSYYTGSAWNAPCQPASNWSGVTLSHNPVTNQVSASLPSIAASCQNIFYTNCGMYGTGTVPYYFIEFDVKVTDTSALGNIPNQFTVSGGNLASPATSNVDLINVTGTTGYTLLKDVKQAGSGSYASSAAVPAGGTAQYRLRLSVAPGSVGLRHITMADLLPRNDGTNDKLILGPCTPRGSQFDVTYASTVASTPTASPWNNSAVTPPQARVDNFAPIGAPGPMFAGGCGSAGTWGATLSPGARNLGYYFGATPIGAGGNATVEFTGTVSTSALSDEKACNTFAANGAVRHLINSSIVTDQKVGELESNLACISVKQTDPQGCLEKIQISLKCAGKDAAGNQQYSFTMSGWNAATAAVLMLGSPDGAFMPATFSIPAGSFTVGSTFTHLPPYTNPVTITWQLVANGVVICRDSVKVDVPPCDDEPPVDCCKEFIRRIDHKGLTYSPSGAVALSAFITAGPAPLQKFSATIIGVQRRTVCGTTASAWQRCFGDVTSASLTNPLSPGPTMLSIFSRAAQWGPGPCESFMTGATLNLNMIFPAPPASFKCRDTLVFAIQYSFTDCKCVTCNKIVYDTVVRRHRFLPWDPVLWTGISAIRPTIAKQSDQTQADTAAFTSVVMSSQSEGTLWFINPKDSNNTITVSGIEISSPTVPLIGLSSGGTDGLLMGTTGFIGVNAPAGSATGVDLKFDNPNNVPKWTLNVRYLYAAGDGESPEFSDIVEYVARVPNSTPDKVEEDVTSPPEKVRTYMLTFTNANGYKEHVREISFSVASPLSILAVGPSGTDGSTARITLLAAEADKHVASATVPGIAGVEPGGTVRPLYLTVSGVEDSSATVDFVTYDNYGQVLSSGTLTLQDPIASVSGSTDPSAVRILGVAPNPAGTSITISALAPIAGQECEISIVDLTGTIVSVLHHGILSAGNNGIYADVSTLPQGRYTLVLRTPTGAVSTPVVIVR